MRPLLLALLYLTGFYATAAESLQILEPRVYAGMCDASAGIELSHNSFVVACDEDNLLRVYRTDKAGPPVRQFDLAAMWQFPDKSLETDLEGAARMGDRIFWIGSHGLSKAGKLRSNRRCFLVTDIIATNGDVTLKPVGQPCFSLLNDLIGDDRFKPFQLDAASQLAPKEPGGLNIEGIAATPDGQLLIGFRSPIPTAKTLLIPLLNPNKVIEGTPARFGDPILLDLDGLGIRDIVRYEETYLIMAGPYHGGSGFKLFRWDGPGKAPNPVRIDGLNQYHPEGLIVYSRFGSARVQVLSDDGARMVGDCACKDLKDAQKQTFRSFWISP